MRATTLLAISYLVLPSTNKVFIYLLTYSPLKSDPTIFQELRQLFQDAFVIASVVSGVPFHRPQQQSWKPIIVVNIFLMLHMYEYGYMVLLLLEVAKLQGVGAI